MRIWSYSDLHDLWFPAKENVCSRNNNNGDNISYLKMLIGLDQHVLLQDNFLTEKQRTLLKMLAGPYGKTIAKAIEANRGNQNGPATETCLPSDDQAKAEQT